MNGYIRAVALLLISGVGSMGIAQNLSGNAAQESKQASTYASASAAHALVASGQTTLALSAVPLSAAGMVLSATGATSTAIARDSARASNRSRPQTLDISDETFSLMRPDMVLKLTTPTPATLPKAKTE